jgi:hypothetical protein
MASDTLVHRSNNPMPHVVVEQAGPLEVVFAALDPFAVAEGNLILRISDVFLNRRGTIVLLEAVVVDKPRSQTFFVQLSQKDQAVTVRLLRPPIPKRRQRRSSASWPWSRGAFGRSCRRAATGRRTSRTF